MEVMFQGNKLFVEANQGEDLITMRSEIEAEIRKLSYRGDVYLDLRPLKDKYQYRRVFFDGNFFNFINSELTNKLD